MSDISYVANAGEDTIFTCLSMIMQVPVENIINDFFEHLCFMNSDHPTESAWHLYLSSHGYATQDVKHEYEVENILIGGWPIKPFAPVHVIRASHTKLRYAVMLNDGNILDPIDVNIRSRHEYRRIYSITGIWKVSDSLDFLKTENGSTRILPSRSI